MRSEIRKKNVLRGEMAKYGITITEMAKVLGITYTSMSRKVNGKSDFTLSEARRIVRHLNSLGDNHTVESLFFN